MNRRNFLKFCGSIPLVSLFIKEINSNNVQFKTINPKNSVLVKNKKLEVWTMQAAEDLKFMHKLCTNF